LSTKHDSKVNDPLTLLDILSTNNHHVFRGLHATFLAWPSPSSYVPGLLPFRKN